MKRETQDSKQEVVESIEQFASAWKVFVGECPNAEIVDRPGLSIRWNASSFPFWKAVFITEQVADEGAVAARIREASEYMRIKSEAGLLWVSKTISERPHKRAFYRL